MYGMLTNKHTIASFELEKKEQGEDKEE